jgi:hypothetical protein
MNKLNFFKLGEIKHTFVFNVPFTQKDSARNLGMKWNPVIKKWCFYTTTNGKSASIKSELGKIYFKVIDIDSDAFEWKPKQKQKLLKWCNEQLQHAEAV